MANSSAVLTSSASPPAATTPPSSYGSKMGLCAAVLLLGHVPLLYYHFSLLLSKPHYQFLAVLPVGVGWLAWSRRREAGEVRPGSPWVAGSIATFAAALLLAATYLWSPWLASVAAMFTALAALVAIGGGMLTRAMLPAWWLSWLFVSLPFDADVDLTKFLRTVATSWTSELLDQFGVLHLVDGNVIEVPGHSFFVADACSGIHSLFVILAAALLLGFAQRRTILQMLVLLVCACGLVMVENLFRLLGVVAGDRIGIDLSEGTPHTIFGLAVFVVTLFLLWSADQLVSFLLPETLFDWSHRRPAEAGRAVLPVSVPAPSTSITAVPRGYFGIAACFAAIGIWQLTRAPTSAPPPPVLLLADALTNLAQLTVDDLPLQLEGFQRQSLRFEQRSQDDPKGSHSQIWTYSGDGLQFEFSVDYAYGGVRDLCLCYELTGWSVDEQQRLGDGPGAIVEAKLSKPFRGEARLYYSFFNAAGETGVRVYSREERQPLERYWERLTSFVTMAGQPAPEEPSWEIVGPVAQIQLFAAAANDLTPSQRDRLVRFYRASRDRLRQASVVKLRGAS